MYGSLRVAAVIPARNEERLIGKTIWPVPDIVDTIYVIDDGSRDRTAEIVQHYARSDSRIRLIQHRINRGVGAAIISGYHHAYKDGHDAFVVVGGDAQMDWLDLEELLKPIANGIADYTKGNRFMYGRSSNTPGNAWREMPVRRIFGNVCLSILTKFASGYYHINDSQMGYTSMHRRVYPRVNWFKARKGYGYPAEWLIRFHSHGVRVADVPVRAIYLPNERQTQIRVRKFVFYMMGIIVKGGIERINREYLFGKVTLPTIRVPTISIPIRSVFQSIGARIRSFKIIDRIGNRNPIRFGIPPIFSRIRKSYSGSKIDKAVRMNVQLSNPFQIQGPFFDSYKDSSTDQIINLANRIVRDYTILREPENQRVSGFDKVLVDQYDKIKTRLSDDNYVNDLVEKLRELVHKDEI